MDTGAVRSITAAAGGNSILFSQPALLLSCLNTHFEPVPSLESSLLWLDETHLSTKDSFFVYSMLE